MTIFPETPKLESQNCPETVLVGVPGLWELITLDFRVRLRRGLNQSYSSPRELSNVVSHYHIGCWENTIWGKVVASPKSGPW
jgi:hypothetical protein